MRRLRDRSVKRSAHDRFSDLWESTKIVLRALAAGESRLGLPALAGIFAKTQCPDLDTARLENRSLLHAIFKLGWLRVDTGLSRVNWRDMGPEELGSVYESLLELVPQITQDGRVFKFASGAETKGNARKTSGSYYTPDSLVQVLLDSALEPVIADTVAKNPASPVEALLSLSIVDPACGSGHFLLAATRRLAVHVARHQAYGTPSAGEYRHALRQVVGRCIYGVDLNPMAVELCKVSLWMEAVEPGLPLTFLNSHIQHGNALLGTTPELMAKGIPDAAWDPIEGDDKKVASALKKRNKKAEGGQRRLALFATSAGGEVNKVGKDVAELEAASDADSEALAKKEGKWGEILQSQAFSHQRLVANAWCAAFVWPKQPGALSDAAPTNELWWQLRDGQDKPAALTVQTTEKLAEQYMFFHWPLQFPQVFAKGGFDVVLGNPPWERVKLQEQEFFASRSDEIASAPNASARKKIIAALPQEDPQLWNDWCAASRSAEGESHLICKSGCYPLCGKGDINTYSLFAEHDRVLIAASGRAGLIVPTGIATDDTTKAYFRAILDTGQLQSLYDFQTGPETFGNLAHGALRFCLLTLCRNPLRGPVDLFFLAKAASDLRDSNRHIFLSKDDFALLNPNTRTCPTFLSKRDADINVAIYRRAGVVWREEDPNGNPWHLRFMAMIHMANDSNLFRTRLELEAAGWKQRGNQYELNQRRMLPLIEAKMVDHFDHRYASLVGIELGRGRLSRKLVGWYSAISEDPNEFAQPQYWVSESEADSRLGEKWPYGWLLGWRKIARSTDQRTLVASLVPRAATGDSFYITTPVSMQPQLISCLYANMCTFVTDYAARQKVGGSNFVYHTFRQIPLLKPQVYAADCSFASSKTICDWLVPRVLELAYTAWDLEHFARDVGYEGPPFRWDAERRFLLRCEIDAAFFNLYGLLRDDTDYVMNTFPIVRRNDEKTHGEYRTKRVILEIYDAMADAARTGNPYQTRLDPPPAEPSVAHPDTRGAKQ